MLDEFKKFAMRGSVVDMAVGIVIGAAFGKIVSSFVGDVLMPPIGLAMGGVDFSELFVNLGSGVFPTLAAAKAACEAHRAAGRMRVSRLQDLHKELVGNQS